MTILDDGELEEMVSYRKNMTGIENTIFISPRGKARHAPRIKVAIDPPHSINPLGKLAVIDFDGKVIMGTIDPALLEQVRRFIERNRATLLDYWNYQLYTDELQLRLKAID